MIRFVDGQAASGGNTDPLATSFDIALPATTPGNSLVLTLTGLNAYNTLHPNTGVDTAWGTNPVARVSDAGGAAGSALWVKPVTAAETTWTIKAGSGLALGAFSYDLREATGLGTIELVEAVGTNPGAAIANGASKSTGTAPENASVNSLLLSVFGWSGPGLTGSWSGYNPDDFVELAEAADAAGGATRYGHAVAYKITETTTGQFSAAATFSGAGNERAWAMIAVLRGEGSPVRSPLYQFGGFGQGTDAGIANTTAFTEADSLVGRFTGTNAAGTWRTHYQILAAAALNSAYGLRINTSAATCYLPLWSFPLASVPVTGCWSWPLRVRTGTTGTVVVAEGVTGSTTYFQVLYDTSTSKYGVRTGTTGTVAWQSGTTALDTPVWIDLRADSGNDIIDWRLTDMNTSVATDQPAATGAFSQVQYLRYGGNVAQTLVADYGEAVMSRFWAAHPLGVHEISMVLVDPAGTPTAIGNGASAVSVFTGNGTTLTPFSTAGAVAARQAVADMPPVVSAAASGVCQTVTDTGAFLRFPMAPPVVPTDRVVAGVGFVGAMWGGTGAGTGQLAVRFFDGTTTTVIIPATTSYDAGSPTVESATDPLWLTKVWTPAGGWKPSLYAGWAIDIGGSPDGTPDMGVLTFGLKVALKKALKVVSSRVFDMTTGGQYLLEKYINPETSAVTGIVATVPPTGQAVVKDLSGTQLGTVTGAESPKTIPVVSDQFGDVDPRLEITG